MNNNYLYDHFIKLLFNIHTKYIKRASKQDDISLTLNCT